MVNIGDMLLKVFTYYEINKFNNYKYYNRYTEYQVNIVCIVFFIKIRLVSKLEFNFLLNRVRSYLYLIVFKLITGKLIGI